MWNTIAWVGVASGLVASIMEVIKYKAYKDRATFKNMTILGILFSIIVSPLLYFGFGLLGTVYSIPIYSFIIFFIQKELNMKLIRPKIKSIIQKKLDKL